MADPLKIVNAVTGLEVWATGTPDEVDLVRRMLAANGAFAQRPEPPTPLAGADKGRVHCYFRVIARTT